MGSNCNHPWVQWVLPGLSRVDVHVDEAHRLLVASQLQLVVGQPALVRFVVQCHLTLEDLLVVVGQSAHLAHQHVGNVLLRSALTADLVLGREVEVFKITTRLVLLITFVLKLF